MGALEALGFPTTIIASNSLVPKKFLSRVATFLIFAFRLLFQPAFSPVGKYAFTMTRIMFNLYLRVELKKLECYRFWTRDIRLARFLEKYFSNSRIILEIHQFPNARELPYLRQLGERVLICPISVATQSKVNELKLVSRTALLPMGVPEHFYSGNCDVTKVEFQAGYFGSFFNSGRDQGVSTMIHNLIPYLSENPSAKLLLVGIGEDGQNFLEELEMPLSIRERIVAYTYVNHAQIPELMRQCSVLILPYPEGDFFAARFPIKAMEYAAVSRSVLCTRTESHTNIFSEDEVWFYSQDVKDDLTEKLKKILNSDRIAIGKIKNAHEKSKDYSYSSRILRIIDFLQ
jgi:hypothetical protein